MSEDLVSIAKAYDAAWNAHDEEEVLRYYNDDVVIPVSYTHLTLPTNREV